MRLSVFLYAALLAAALGGIMPVAADDKRTRNNPGRQLVDEIAAQESGRGGGREHPGRRMVEELNLTADQEARFREISARHGPIRRDYSRRIEELREKINQELLRDRPSRSLLAQLAGQMGETQKKMNIASVEHFLDVKAVLTAEQFQKFTEMASVGGSGGRGARRGGDSRTDGGDPDDD
ncbi:MAG: periplasmic heavy metal sensor [Chitinispirillia bacterium]|nr:periplasmic heavy metal sensor [Chitinispirillia bacterium]MCL2269275.1 periplasmic heavy metal sensor [Chitinispirillia bacterium]